jgi:hypothetical protein
MRSRERFDRYGCARRWAGAVLLTVSVVDIQGGLLAS